MRKNPRHTSLLLLYLPFPFFYLLLALALFLPFYPLYPVLTVRSIYKAENSRVVFIMISMKKLETATAM